MAKSKNKLPLTMPDDSTDMRRAIAWCASNGLPIRRTSKIQIKVGPFNFYPDSGSWNSDLEPHKKKGGFPAFREAVELWNEQGIEQYGITL